MEVNEYTQFFTSDVMDYFMYFLENGLYFKDDEALQADVVIPYKLTEKWIPNLYFTYNYKTDDNSIHISSSLEDSLFYYKRDVYAYLIDVEFHPDGNFIWHFGMQRQFYYNNQGEEFTDRRLLLGFEYRYKNIWFYFVEAMEGDFPTPKWLHNHTYVQLMLKF